MSSQSLDIHIAIFFTASKYKGSFCKLAHEVTIVSFKIM